ncbi:MAG TPA: hypothetical protein VK274_03155, partial [Pyrinomonadaceae bacterium]|nr:hypothetical protein [Pyrinomonadaceae bacterium]
SDGILLGSYATGPGPMGVTFDGGNILVANAGSAPGSGGGISKSVTSLRASDGSSQGPILVGSTPRAIVFDGRHIWVANFGSNNVSKR